MQSFQVIEQIELSHKVINSQENDNFMGFLELLDIQREALESSSIHILDIDNTPTDVSRFIIEHRNNVSTVKQGIKKKLRAGSVFAAIRRLGEVLRG